MLDKYRQEIDQIDKQIIELLAKRFEIVKKVGDYKKENNLPPLDETRWYHVLSNRKNLARKLNLDENFIEKIWDEIHKYALKLES